MVQSGRDSPAKVGKVTDPSPSPRWDIRPPKARRKMKRTATPHPGKVGGNAKRNALVSLTETGRVRKKIVFELDELAAGINGGPHAHAGVDMVSSPTGDRKGGRWTRKARAGPFEASYGDSDVVPGVLPLLAKDLHFSMGRKEEAARKQPEDAAGNGEMAVAGVRPEVGRPVDVNSAAALGGSWSTLVEVDARLASMDEDNIQIGDGANMLSESTNLVAPFPEMSSCLLENKTCDMQQDKNEFEFKFGEGIAFPPNDAKVAGKEEVVGKPPATEYSPENSPASNEGSGAAPSERPPEHVPSADPKAAPSGNGGNRIVEPVLGGQPENRNAELGNGGAPKTDPVTLDDAHDKEMGTAGRCEGVPSLTFSNEETRLLADKIGHAIIGKFSHTIPTSQQIQKSLSHIHFIDGFKWKFVNAKHILIQFRDARDYGRMLNGPNGSPVWNIEQHPMRVFKWTPDFDTFFESPIAVVWCKVIGLPIHLYDQSALVAIGKLLGKPIQVDRATFNQTRLSFARICIEIDISTPPPEEIILNILGKDTRYKVVWERIPLFCVDCKHVGHVKDTCLAVRRKEGQPAKGPNRLPHTRRPNTAFNSTRRDWRPKKPPSDIVNPKPDRETAPMKKTEPGPSKEKRGADVTSSVEAPSEVQVQVDEDGFQLVSNRRKGKVNYPRHQAQGGAHNASYLETLLKGSNVATVSFGKTNDEVIDPGGSSTVPT